MVLVIQIILSTHDFLSPEPALILTVNLITLFSFVFPMQTQGTMTNHECDFSEPEDAFIVQTYVYNL